MIGAAVGMAMSLAMSMAADGASADATVTNLRLGSHANIVRLVLDADAPLPLAVTTTEDGGAIIIELPGVTWQAPNRPGQSTGLIARHAYSADGLLVVETRRPAKIAKAFRLPPDETHLHRLVIDLVADPDARPAAETAFETVSVSLAQASPINDWLRSEGGNPNLGQARQGLHQATTPPPAPMQQASGHAVYSPLYTSPPMQPYPPPVQQGQNVYQTPGGLDYGGNSSGRSGIYLAGGLGLGFQKDPVFSGGLFDAKGIVADNAFAGYAAIGRAFRSNLRLEGELTFNTGDLEQLDVDATGNINTLTTGVTDLKSGTWSAVGVMFNAAYDFPISSRVRPFALVGIGLAFVSASDVEISDSNQVIDEVGQAFGFQFGGGINIAVNDRLSIDAQYRFFTTSDAGLETVNEDGFDAGFNSHSFLVGARYQL